jgi:hypothetical protein
MEARLSAWLAKQRSPHNKCAIQYFLSHERLAILRPRFRIGFPIYEYPLTPGVRSDRPLRIEMRMPGPSHFRKAVALGAFDALARYSKSEDRLGSLLRS